MIELLLLRLRRLPAMTHQPISAAVFDDTTQLEESDRLGQWDDDDWFDDGALGGAAASSADGSPQGW
ncbi:MAG: hypothetical protein VKJ87_06580 [Synechococcus sp.]|nr:hypothetical protein [Synechococcus sp.]